MHTGELAVAFGLLLVAFFLNRYLKVGRKKLPPGPAGLPFVGYLPFLDAKNPHYTLTQLAGKYGKIYSLQMGNVFAVVLSDVKLIREAFALDTYSGRAPLYLTHGIMKGNGIICAHGEKWREQRKFVVNCLKNFGMVKFGKNRFRMHRDVKNGVNEMMEKIKMEGENSIDVENFLMHSLGNVVFNLVFGKTWNEEDETWKKLIRLQEEGTKLIGVAGPINFLPILRFLPKYKNAIEYIESGIRYSHEIYQKILEEHKRKWKEESPDEGNEESKMAHFLGAFHQEMEKRKNESSFYTPTQFNYLMADLWGAGVDTTITTLRWFFLHVAHSRQVQTNIQKEMDDILGEEELTMENVSFLPYLQASLSEVQRLCSVTPLGIPHGTTEDSVLHGYDVPKGSMIVPLQWAIHMNPEVHENPETYDPNRFLDDDGKYRKPESFMPFQTGKRVCPGENYAKIMLLLYGGTILQNFTLSLESPADFEGEIGITLTPKPHKIKFRPRKKII